MKIKLFVISILFLCLNQTLVSQEVENEIIEKYNSFKYNHSEEAAFLKTDKKIYFSGGVITYNLVIFDQYLRPSGLSKIAYLELVNESNKLHKKYVIRLEEGVNQGNIEIPLDIPTGNYQLVAYTQFMRNFDFEGLSHRVPLYIQNTIDAPQKVVKEINYDQQNSTQSNDLLTGEYEINLRVEPSNINVEVSSSAKNSMDYYLISEGFGTLQFIAKVKLKRKNSFLRIAKDQFMGSFQKLILVDENMTVLALKNFYLANDDLQSSEKLSNDQLEIGFKENLIATVELHENEFGVDSLALLKRMFMIYYEIPLFERIDHLNYNELISQEHLDEFSKFGVTRWSDILNGKVEEKELIHYPEDNITLSGKVTGDVRLLKNATLSVHFFENNLDINLPIDELGQFSVDLIVPVGEDAFYTAVIDEKGNDISDQLELSFHSLPSLAYETSVGFYEENLTDELIESQKNFNYILSTFNQSGNKKKFFWENSYFDRKIKIEDYRDIEDFEEFVREVVTGVRIKVKDGVKSLRMINSEDGSFFDGAPLIILNNKVLSSSTVLWELPLEEVVSVNLIFSEDGLSRFGDPFKNGVIIIKYEGTVPSIPTSDLNNRYFSYSSYKRKPSINDVQRKFNTTKVMRISTKDYFVETLPKNTKEGSYTLILQGIKADGTYFGKSEEVSINQ